MFVKIGGSQKQKIKKIILNPQWIPLDEIVKHAPAIPGIYLMAFDKPIKYDKGISRIIYIGSGIDLRKRLQQHRKDSNIYLFQYMQNKKDNLNAFFYPFKEANNQGEILEIEQDAFSSFINKFGVYPIGNWLPPDGYLGTLSLDGNNKYEYFKYYVVHVEDQSGVKPLTYDDLATEYGLEYVKEYDRVEFRPKGFSEKAKKRQRHRNIEKFSTISMSNIACWDLHKHEALIKIAKTLIEDRNKKIKTRRFKAPTSKVPRPHTWGEVAVILARILTDSWYPEQKLFVEIYHNKKLLGKGRVSESGGRGWDKSDLPQRNSQRPVWLLRFEKIDQKAEKEAWELHERGKPPPSNAIGHIIEEDDWYCFRLFDWVKEEREKEFIERPERLFKQLLSNFE
jgi:hypothetical protein